MNSNDSSRAHMSNQTPQIAIQWQNTPNSGRSMAAYTDDGVTPDEVLQICLSGLENQQAAALHDPIERRHFIARRSFQRLFLSEILALDRSPAMIAVIHQRDARPVCLDAPDLHLSFSSSGNTFIACASKHNAVGIDVECKRVISNASDLAKRFFTPEEADTLAALPEAEQSLHFLYYWTAKEASLKAIGKGIVYGLNTFMVERIGNGLSYKINHSAPDSGSWNLQHLDLVPQYLVALVEKNPVNKI